MANKDKGKREIDTSVGMRLKHFREKKGYSLYDAGKLAKVSPSYLHRIETGERKAPSYPILETLAGVLGTTVYQLTNTPVDEDKTRSVIEVLMTHEYTVKERKADRQIKDALIALIQTVISSRHPSEYQQGVLIIKRAQELCSLLN